MEEENPSVFVEYFGSSPYIKVLDFMIEGQEFDYSMTEVARKARVGWSAFTKVWEQLLARKLIIPTRAIGNAKLFRLNKKNPIVQKLIRLDWEITKLATDQLLEEHNVIV